MRKSLSRPFLVFLAALSVGVAFCGCSGGSGEPLPELTEVTGTVTLDGKPLPGVSVAFRPESKGGTSRGTTDADGKFELRYSAEAVGAVAGKHVVRIEINDMERDASVIPEKYRGETSELTAEVPAAGPCEINFELKSK